jgi:hypothetical protein
MFKAIGHKIELFNAFCEQGTSTDQVKEAILDVHLELLMFCTFLIQHFRRDDMFGGLYLVLLVLLTEDDGNH